jgi:hypothetical protein
MRYAEPRLVSDHHALVNAGKRIVCERRRLERRRGARARRSVPVNPVPNLDRRFPMGIDS